MRSFRLVLFIFAVFFSSKLQTALAAPGDLDPSFDFNGIAVLSLSGQQDIPGGLAVQPDGKILVGGVENFSGAETRLVVARLLPDGALDAGFGQGGKFFSPMMVSGSTSGLELQGDGKIVIGTATVGSDVLLLRLLPDGSLDPDFGSGGVAEGGGVAGTGAFQALALQKDGKIVVAGVFGGDVGGFTVFRFLPGGELDPDFGTGGFRTDSLSDFVEFPQDLAILPDGRILSVGFTNDFTVNEILLAVARYTSDGNPDPSLDGDGFLLTNLGNAQGANGLTVLPRENGAFLVGGALAAGGDPQFYVARFNADGSPDAAFDENGLTTVDFGFDSEFAVELLPAPDGKIYTFGVASSDRVLLLTRILPDGRLDESFGSAGRLAFSQEPVLSSLMNHAAFQPDGKIVLSAAVSDDSGSDFAVYRFLGEESVSPSCGDGTVEAGEECDDGNNADGDGCSAACKNEQGSDVGGGGCRMGGASPPAARLLMWIGLPALLALRRFGRS